MYFVFASMCIICEVCLCQRKVHRFLRCTFRIQASEMILNWTESITKATRHLGMSISGCCLESVSWTLSWKAKQLLDKGKSQLGYNCTIVFQTENQFCLWTERDTCLCPVILSSLVSVFDTCLCTRVFKGFLYRVLCKCTCVCLKFASARSLHFIVCLWCFIK